MKLSISKIKRNFENIFIESIKGCEQYKHIDHPDTSYYIKNKRVYFTVCEKFLNVVYEDCWSICEKEYEMKYIEARDFVKQVLKQYYNINNIDDLYIGKLDRSWFSVLEKQYRFKHFIYLINVILKFLKIDLKLRLHYTKV